MADWTMRANDRLPSIAATLRGADGAPTDLTGAAVKFQMNAVAGGANKVNSAATIVSAVAGTVQYDWLAIDTDTPGDYVFTWEVTFASGKKLTYPNGANMTLTIVTDLA